MMPTNLFPHVYESIISEDIAWLMHSTSNIESSIERDHIIQVLNWSAKDWRERGYDEEMRGVPLQIENAKLREELEAQKEKNSILAEELFTVEGALKLSAAKYKQDIGVHQFAAVHAEQLVQHWKQRAEELQAKLEAAEARIREAEEQEPHGWWHEGNTLEESDYFPKKDFPQYGGSGYPLYTRPIPAPAQVLNPLGMTG